MTDLPIKTAVITGNHAFDVPGFTRLFRVLPNVNAYVQSLDNFAADAGGVRDWYDVVLFYNFHQGTPGSAEAGSGLGERVWKTLARLGETEQGIVVLHHALLAFRGWSFWSDIVGIAERGFGYDHDQHLTVEVADPTHPITQDIHSWEMVDETYTVNEPGPNCHVLLTTDHPKSMKALAWIHTFKRARVFCYESGHDAKAFDNVHFQTVLARGIAWAARRI
ncbi:MAG: ThuA domain-containing protein [Anaerolineae bacterium]